MTRTTAQEEPLVEIPRIISVDDHVVEPPELWFERLPADMRERGPRVTRQLGVSFGRFGSATRIPDPEATGADWCDVWRYEDLVWPLYRATAHSGYESEDGAATITYVQILPGAYEASARLEVMDRNHTD